MNEKRGGSEKKKEMDRKEEELRSLKHHNTMVSPLLESIELCHE